MKRSLCVAAAVLTVVGAAVTAVPASGAAGTYTTITSPKGPGQPIYYFYKTSPTTPTLTLSGRTSPDVAHVNVYCFYDHDSHVFGPLNAAPIAMTADHTFTASGQTVPTVTVGCVLRALPDTYTNVSGSTNSGYAGAFSGPTFYVGNYSVMKNSAGKASDAVLTAAQRHAYDVVGSPDWWGVFVQMPADDFTLIGGRLPGIWDLAIAPSNVVPASATPGHSGIRVDGVSAYLPYSLNVFAAAADQVAPITNLSITRAASTGGVRFAGTFPLRTCGATYPQGAGTCTAPVNPGVSLRRTVVSSAEGTLLIVRDRFISTDNAKHTVRVEYRNPLQGQPYGQLGVRMPGESSFRAPPVNTVLGTQPLGPRTVYVTTDRYATDGTPSRSDLGITYSGRPTVYFNDVNTMAFRYVRTVPKGGEARISFGQETAFSMSRVRALASTAQNTLRPSMVITAPTKNQQVSSYATTVKGYVGNASNGYPTSVKVWSGTKSRTVAVTQTGSNAGHWTAGLRLTKGWHTVHVRGTDPSGIVLTAARVFHHT